MSEKDVDEGHSKCLWCIPINCGVICLTIWMGFQAVNVVWISYFAPGWALYLSSLSVLPFFVLLFHYYCDSAKLRYFIYITYTLCVVTSILIGSLGPWVIGARYWNN